MSSTTCFSPAEALSTAGLTETLNKRCDVYSAISCILVKKCFIPPNLDEGVCPFFLSQPNDSKLAQTLRQTLSSQTEVSDLNCSDYLDI